MVGWFLRRFDFGGWLARIYWNCIGCGCSLNRCNRSNVPSICVSCYPQIKFCAVCGKLLSDFNRSADVFNVCRDCWRSMSR